MRRLRHREVFVPLRHDPGHAQVDFGEALAEIAGVEAQDPLLCDGPAAQRRLFRAGLSGGDRRSVLRRAQRRVRVLRQGAALDPVRQHHAGGGAHPGRRGAPAHAGVQRAAVALRVCRPVRPAGQGQRQRQGRGADRLDPPEPAGAGAAGGQLDGAERAAARGLSAPARGSAARSRGDDRRTAGAGSGGVPRPCRRRPTTPARRRRAGSARYRWCAIAAPTTRCRPPMATARF